MEQELDFFRRQLTGSNQVLSRPAAPTSGSEGAGAKIASDVLREQVKSLENELQREAEEGRELRRRLMDRETEIEKALRDVSELRSGSVLLQQECDEFRRKLETAKSNGPKEEEGWFKVPQVRVISANGFKYLRSENQLVQLTLLTGSSHQGKSLGYPNFTTVQRAVGIDSSITVFDAAVLGHGSSQTRRTFRVEDAKFKKSEV